MEWNSDVINRVIHYITGEIIKPEERSKFIDNFIYKFVQKGDRVLFQYLEDNEVTTCEATVQDTVIIEEIDLEFLQKAVNVKSDDNVIFDVPIRNIDYELAIKQIAMRLLSPEDMEYIQNPSKRVKEQFSDIQLISNCNFGYEIEGGFNVPDYERLIEPTFRIVGDSSVHTPATYGNIELVYNGYDKGERLLEKTFQGLVTLQEKQFQYNNTCGIHIHVSQFEPHENNDRTWDLYQLIKFTKFYIDIEDAFYLLVPPDRTFKHHCKKTSLSNERFYKAIKNLPSRAIDTMAEIDENKLRKTFGTMWYNMEDFETERTGKYDDTRYTGYNIHSYFFRGTLEFRHFDGNYHYLPCFLDFIDKLLNFSLTQNAENISNFTNCLKNIKPLEGITLLLETIEVSPLTKEFFLKRTKEFYPQITEWENFDDIDINENENNEEDFEGIELDTHSTIRYDPTEDRAMERMRECIHSFENVFEESA